MEFTIVNSDIYIVNIAMVTVTKLKADAIKAISYNHL
jgi:hypothetical protein